MQAASRSRALVVRRLPPPPPFERSPAASRMADSRTSTAGLATPPPLAGEGDRALARWRGGDDLAPALRHPHHDVLRDGVVFERADGEALAVARRLEAAVRHGSSAASWRAGACARLRLLPRLAVVGMIAALLPSPGVAPDRLNVPDGRRADPDIGPGRRNDELTDAPDDVRVGYPSALSRRDRRSPCRPSCVGSAVRCRRHGSGRAATARRRRWKEGEPRHRSMSNSPLVGTPICPLLFAPDGWRKRGAEARRGPGTRLCIRSQSRDLRPPGFGG